MTSYVAAADYLREAFSCAVVIVHHCGHEGSRPRGHTALMGAADAQIGIQRSGEIATAHLDWMKDGTDGNELSFTLSQVVVGSDVDGDDITSCVVEPADTPTARPKARKLAGDPQTAFDALCNLVSEAGQSGPAQANGIMCVRADAWKAATLATLHWSQKTPAALEKAWRRVMPKLSSRVGHYDGWVWILPKPLFDE